jgi:hypothetical protein
MELDNRKILQKMKNSISTDLNELSKSMNLDFFTHSNSNSHHKGHAKKKHLWHQALIGILSCAIVSVIACAWVDNSIDNTSSDLTYRIFHSDYPNKVGNNPAINQLSSLINAQNLTILSQNTHSALYQQTHDNIIHQIDLFFINSHTSNLSEKTLTILPNAYDLDTLTLLIFQSALPVDIQQYYAHQLQKIIELKISIHTQEVKEKLAQRNSYDVSHFRSDSRYMNEFIVETNRQYGYLWFLSNQILNHTTQTYYQNQLEWRQMPWDQRKEILPQGLFSQKN